MNIMANNLKLARQAKRERKKRNHKQTSNARQSLFNFEANDKIKLNNNNFVDFDNSDDDSIHSQHSQHSQYSDYSIDSQHSDPSNIHYQSSHTAQALQQIETSRLQRQITRLKRQIGKLTSTNSKLKHKLAKNRRHKSIIASIKHVTNYVQKNKINNPTGSVTVIDCINTILKQFPSHHLCTDPNYGRSLKSCMHIFIHKT